MARIGVVGGGIAGLAASESLLDEGHEVVVFEAGPRAGGNAFGVDVRGADGRAWTIDAGVSDFNRNTFHEVTRLARELGLETRPIGTDVRFGTTDGNAWLLLPGSGQRTPRTSAGFATRLGDPHDLARGLALFRERAPEALEHARFGTWSLARYLDHLGLTADRAGVVRACLLGRAMGSFPMPDRDPRSYGLTGIVKFWSMHGIVGSAPADRHTVAGGMHSLARAYALRLAARGVRLEVGARVARIVRRGRGVDVHARTAADRIPLVERFDHVVFAGHAGDALRVLDDVDLHEKAILSRFERQRARVVVHDDPRLIGGDSATDPAVEWGAFNYLLPGGEGRAWPRVRPTITFYPKRLAGLPEQAPDVLVSMNPHREPERDRVIAERWLWHPIASAETRAAIRALPRLQGHRRTWYCGAHTDEPFLHESALVSGRRVGALLAMRQRAAAARCPARSPHEDPPRRALGA